MKEVQTIGSVAREILNNFSKKKYLDGLSRWELREDIEWQSNILLSANQHQEPTIKGMRALFNVLMEIYIADNKTEAIEFLHDLESNEELAELTAWLNASSENIKFVNSVLENSELRNGHSVLAAAYKQYLYTIGHNLIDAIETYIMAENEVSAYLI